MITCQAIDIDSDQNEDWNNDLIETLYLDDSRPDGIPHFTWKMARQYPTVKCLLRPLVTALPVEKIGNKQWYRKSAE